MLNLAVAFETLLRLPESSKKDRLVDAISLLLGRTDRLDDWANQFYAARSRIAHEGQLSDSYFYAPGAGKPRQADIFGSLMLFGRMIFQLCVGTLLVGIDLAERAQLQEKFITNCERYKKICELLADETRKPGESFWRSSRRFAPSNAISSSLARLSQGLRWPPYAKRPLRLWRAVRNCRKSLRMRW